MLFYEMLQELIAVPLEPTVLVSLDFTHWTYQLVSLLLFILVNHTAFTSHCKLINHASESWNGFERCGKTAGGTFSTQFTGTCFAVQFGALTLTQNTVLSDPKADYTLVHFSLGFLDLFICSDLTLDVRVYPS
jgi:hypothetical protein